MPKLTSTPYQIDILSAKRTPIGTFNGLGKNIPLVKFGEVALQSVLQSMGFFSLKLGASDALSMFMGCVLPAGVGQNPARQVALKAGLSYHVRTTTLNHTCASGLTAITCSCDQIMAGAASIAIAGGMENMTRAPYLLMNARHGYRFGNHELIDHVLRDGLEDATTHNTMLWIADQVAKSFSISRVEQEDFVRITFEKAQKAVKNGFFNEEIACIENVVHNKENVTFSQDEHIQKVKPENFAKLPPVFSDGTITAATSSPVADGAACLVLANPEKTCALEIAPLARIVGYAYAGIESNFFPRSPVFALQKLSQQLDWPLEQVDLFEINEAFAVVPLLVHQELNIPFNKINVNGGACVLGHPLGCSGARIVVTLVHAMRRLGKKRGMAAICAGGGEGGAVAIELLD